MQVSSWELPPLAPFSKSVNKYNCMNFLVELFAQQAYIWAYMGTLFCLCRASYTLFPNKDPLVEYKRALDDSLIVNSQQYGKRDANCKIYL